jgi:hypothetical protein
MKINSQVLSLNKLGATIFFFLACGLPFLFFVVAGFDKSIDPVFIFLEVVTLIFAANRLSDLMKSGTPRIISSIFWLYIYVTSAVVPLAEISTGNFLFLMDFGTLASAAILNLLAMVSFELGRKIYSRLNALPKNISRREVSAPRLQIISGFGLVMTGIYINQLGGFASFFISRAELRIAIDQSGIQDDGSQALVAILTTLGTIPIFIAFLCWVVRMARDVKCRTPQSVIWVSLTGLLNLVVNNPISNPRYWVLTLAVSLVYSAPGFSARRFRVTIVSGILLALAAFQYFDYFRLTNSANAFVAKSSLAETLTSKDYDQLNMTANGIWWVETYGFTWGKQLLGSLFFWIPRSAWPNKARDTGVEIGIAMHSTNTNLSSPLPIEFWVDFGWIGVLLAFIAIGFQTAKWDLAFGQSISKDRRFVNVTDLLIPLLAGYTFILMRGPLLQSLSRLVVMFAVCAFLAAPNKKNNQNDFAGDHDRLSQ